MKRLSTQHTIGELARAVEWAYPPSGTTSVRGCCRNRTGLLPAIAFIATRLWPGCASFGGHSNSASRWRKSRVCWSCESAGGQLVLMSGRGRTGTAVFWGTNSSATTTPPPEAYTLITIERQ